MFFVGLLHEGDLKEGILWQLNHFVVITLYQQQHFATIDIHILLSSFLGTKGAVSTYTTL